MGDGGALRFDAVRLRACLRARGFPFSDDNSLKAERILIKFGVLLYLIKIQTKVAFRGNPSIFKVTVH